MLVYFPRYKNIKKYFCVLHTANTLTYFECSLKKKLLEVLKMCFRMDFLNTKKIIFLHFRILQHVCKTPKGIGQYSKKIKKSYFGGFHLLFTINVWIKKSQMDEYPKYYWK